MSLSRQQTDQLQKKANKYSQDLQEHQNPYASQSNTGGNSGSFSNPEKKPNVNSANPSKLDQYELYLWQKRKKMQNWKSNGTGVAYLQQKQQKKKVDEDELFQMRKKYAQQQRKNSQNIAVQENFKRKGDQQLRKMVIDNFKYQQPKKRNISEQQQFQIDNQKPQKYKIGEFTLFARNQQKQLRQKQKYISFVLKEAIISYQKRYKQNYQAIKKLMKHQQPQQIQLYFKQSQDLKKFIQNEIQFTINECLNDENFEIYKTASIFIFRKMIARTNAIVDGKFIKLNQLKLQQRFYNNGFIFIPTNQSDVYIKLSQSVVPKKVILLQNKFFQQHQINFINQEAKKQIVSTVIDFLQSKGQLMNKSQVQAYIKAQVNKKYPLN